MSKTIAGGISIAWSCCAVVALMAGAWEFAFGGCALAVCTAVLGENL